MGCWSQSRGPFASNRGLLLEAMRRKGRRLATIWQAIMCGMRSDHRRKAERGRVANRPWVRVVIAAFRLKGRNEELHAWRNR